VNQCWQVVAIDLQFNKDVPSNLPPIVLQLSANTVAYQIAVPVKPMEQVGIAYIPGLIWKPPHVEVNVIWQ